MPLQKHFIFIFSFLFSAFFATAQQRSDTKPASSADPLPDNISTSYSSSGHVEITDSIINYGKLFLNTPYRYGSSGADTFDCSGFTSFVYRNFGYSLTHSSAAQAQQFDTVKRTQLKTGDLVYFGGSRKSRHVGHVGIVVAANGGKFDFIHASCDRGVTISSSEEPYYSRRYITANRVIGGTQLLAVNPSVENDDESDYQSDITVPVTYPAKKVKKTIPAKYHVVKSGETLSEIAEKYNLSVTELKRKNGIKGNKLSLKQRLKVKDEQTYAVVEPIQPTNKSKDETATVESSHKVKHGETLFSISKLYGISVDELKKINNIPNGIIVPGQDIKVTQEAEVVETAPSKKPENSAVTTMHKVISGESLFGVAKMYGVSADELRRINNLPDNNIHAGQVLKIVRPVENATQENTAVVAKSEPSPVAVAVKSVVAPKKETAVQIEAKSEPKLEVKSEQKSEAKPEPRTETAQTPGPVAKTKIIVHKVHPGESLVTLARDFKIPLEELQRINNLEGTKLSVGQEVFICLNPEAIVINPVVPPVTAPKKAPVLAPVVSQVSAARPVAATEVTTVKPVEPVAKADPKPKSTTYKVKRHDNLNNIAQNFNITIDELKQMNGLKGNKISVGQRLKIVQPAEATGTKELAAKPAASEKRTTYKVRKGDNLNTIAQELNTSVEELKRANNLTGNKLTVGQELRVSQSVDVATNAKEKASKPEVPAKSVTYKVKRGENLTTIAKDFNMTLEELKEINNLSDNKIHYGQKLIVGQLTAEAAKNRSSKPEPKPKTLHYKVKSGDSYYTIALKYDCDLKDLKEWNRNVGGKLQPGDILTIKSSGK
jgi:LysM repeat protein